MSMYVAEITFHIPDQGRAEDFENALEHGVYGLLAAWQHGGRMEFAEASMLQLSDRCVVYAHIAEPDALDADAAAVKDALTHLYALSVAAPTVRVLGKAFTLEENCHCGDRSSYILYTTFITRVSSLLCGNCFLPVPLYQIPPISNDNYQELLYWESSYKACDTLDIQSDVLERAAQREMRMVDSKLNRTGRELCRVIEKQTDIPTYYYLRRASGQKKVGSSSHCPACDGDWSLSEPWHIVFSYRCVPSRLVSG